jgi:hypothetical protein
VVSVAALGASYFPLKRIGQRYGMPGIIQMKVFPPFCFAADKVKLHIAVLQNNNVLDPALENLLVKSIQIQDFSTDVFEFFLTKVNAGAGCASLFFASANPMCLSGITG